MATNGDESNARYWAFISYSHRDEHFGRKLHRWLEAYTLPQRLAGRATAFGPAPKHLKPIFRDRDELPASSDLSAEVVAALTASRSLIVVCSPDAVSSAWVCREIELFREIHPGRPVLCALWRGDPSESLPEPLRQISADGSLIEPLAADFRRAGDGRQIGVVKLVSGILGLRLDEVIRRDAARRLQRVTGITIAALTLVVLMLALTIFALVSRADARRQRSEAEGLVEFMQTNLRDGLKRVGRLDIMEAVNQRLLQYYNGQDINSLPAASLERRARIFHAMGEDEETAGRYDLALSRIEEANRTTATLLAESPNDPERIFAHAQTIFWIGSLQVDRKDYANARRSFESYKHFADQLISAEPRNKKYLREEVFANIDLCAVDLDIPKHANLAIQECSAALRELDDLSRHGSLDGELTDNIINVHAWLADTYYAMHDMSHASVERVAEEKLLDRLIAADPKNKQFSDYWVITERALALIEIQTGKKDAAKARLTRALAVADDLIHFEPKNRGWTEDHDAIERTLSTLH